MPSLTTLLQVLCVTLGTALILRGFFTWHDHRKAKEKAADTWLPTPCEWEWLAEKLKLKLRAVMPPQAKAVWLVPPPSAARIFECGWAFPVAGTDELIIARVSCRQDGNSLWLIVLYASGDGSGPQVRFGSTTELPCSVVALTTVALTNVDLLLHIAETQPPLEAP